MNYGSYLQVHMYTDCVFISDISIPLIYSVDRVSYADVSREEKEEQYEFISNVHE